jgi:hypothetical protein
LLKTSGVMADAAALRGNVPAAGAADRVSSALVAMRVRRRYFDTIGETLSISRHPVPALS